MKANISTPMYIAEITPAHIRGRMVAVNQIAIVGGIALTSFINYYIARCGDQAWLIENGWRWTQHTTHSTPEEVYLEVRERIDNFNQDGGFVCNAVHHVQGNSPVENGLAMFKAIKDSGR
jgi:hypothetical protein